MQRASWWGGGYVICNKTGTLMCGRAKSASRSEVQAVAESSSCRPECFFYFIFLFIVLLSNGAAPCSGAGHGAQRPVLLPAHQAGRPQRGLALPPQGGLAPDALAGPVPQLAGILQRRHSGGGCNERKQTDTQLDRTACLTCSGCSQVAHPDIRDQLVGYIYNGFLVPVLAPALHKVCAHLEHLDHIISQLSLISQLGIN